MSTPIVLRPYQKNLKSDVYQSWQSGARNVIAVSPTGSGKTATMASMAVDFGEPTCAIAHRQELVQQISIAMGQVGLPHNIIAPNKVISTIIQRHILEFGRSFLDRRSRMTVAGIDTLIRRADDRDVRQWANTVRYWQGDECHHFLSNNKWGKGVSLFPNARGVGFTATPIRCDRKSLHREQGGVFDDLVIGPSMRELIDLDFLSDYMIYGPPISINESLLKVSKNTGEFTPSSLKTAEERSTLHGDIVQHYLRLAEGKRGITFVHNVDAATHVAQKFREAGVPAECVSAKTPDAVRNAVIDKFRQGTLLQLVNVDLFGEGFDVPAVEVVSMGRATQSFGLYVQQFGRALRTFNGKERGIIIDHVGNVKRHGLPDAVKSWTLRADERGKRKLTDDPEAIPVTSCTACFATYERIHKQCPFCGHVEEPAGRNDPKFVDGDLIEFGPELLEELRQKASAVNGQFDPNRDVPYNLRGTPAERAIAKRYGERQLAHQALADAISLWAGIRRDRGMDDAEIYRRFYYMFGIDVLSAQGIRERKAVEELTAKIQEYYWK